jgi:lactoylglutathione lyase/glyoxylase I family protein
MENKMIEMPVKNPEGVYGKMRAAHIGLRTKDFDGSIRWYTEKLGFRLLKKWSVGELNMAFLAPANDDNFWLEILNGGLSESSQELSQPIISGFQHLCFDVENLDETIAALRENNATVLREPFPVAAIGKRCGFIADLFGNVIELIENI